MISIRWENKDPIMTLKEANCITIRKVPINNHMSAKKFGDIIQSEHSTLRDLSLIIKDQDMPYTVAMHLVRHTKEHCQPEISSGRPDWTGKERDYSTSRWYMEKFTPVGLIRMMEQRLCHNAEEATRLWAEDLLNVMKKHEDEYIRKLAEYCRPPCMKHFYCSELRSCGLYPSREEWMDILREKGIDIDR